MLDGRMYQITRKNEEEIIKLGRFDSVMFKKTLKRCKEEEFGLCVIGYYKEKPEIPILIFFGKNKNKIKGLEILDTTDVVYVNVFKKRQFWIMKISNALKGGE